MNNNEEKSKEIAHNLITAQVQDDWWYPRAQQHYEEALMEMAQWKDEQVKQIQEREINACNNYIEKHPNNKLMLKYHLGRLSLCDELLNTDSKDKINMAFATMD